MNVLSLFDGMSCGRIALDRADIPVENYYASELDKHAITVTQANWPNTIQLGDVNGWRDWGIDWAGIGLLIGGSPCQGFSFAGKQLAFDDPRSKLFFVYLDILNHIKKVNPAVKFMLENVKMKKEHLAVISEKLNIEPIFINSALVSAQNRKRYYWCDWGASAPDDKSVTLSDILENLPDDHIGVAVRDKSKCIRVGGRSYPFGSKQEWDSPFQRIDKIGKLKPGIIKAACLTGGAHSGGNHSDMDILHSESATRRYSAVECERLQTVPDNYTDHVSNTQRYKMLGNGWTVDVICHLFKSMALKAL
jgi:site-specific DNA-cytosine methylase